MFNHYQGIRFLVLCFATSVSIVFSASATCDATQTTKTIEAGKVHEECMKLEPAQRMTYSFQSKTPINFNVHYHVGKEVFYPVKKDSITTHKDVFKPTTKQDYCLMWTNEKKEPALVKYEFRIE